MARWKGYTAEENTLEGLENLKNVRDLVEEFEKEIREEEVRWVKKRKGKQKVIEVELNPEAEEWVTRKVYSKNLVWIG